MNENRKRRNNNEWKFDLLAVLVIILIVALITGGVVGILHLFGAIGDIIDRILTGLGF